MAKKTNALLDFFQLTSTPALASPRASQSAHLLLCAAALLGLLGSRPAMADNIARAGDLLQLVIPAAAYGLTYYENDEEGRMQFYKSFATTIATTQVLKNVVNEKRPNGGDKSFPSGHTSAAFQGAAFIHARYGWERSAPAYLAAAFVGYSRVDSKAHHVRDVIAGAALGTVSSFYFTPSPLAAKKVSMVPFLEGRQVGMTLSLPLN